MSTLENDKFSTAKFIENAINNGHIEDIPEQTKNESEKLILDEISNEKSPEDLNNLPSDSDIHESDQCTLKPTESKEEVTENMSEETESTRDLKSSDREISDDAEEDTDQSEKSLEVEAEEPKEEWQNVLGSGVIMKKILKEGEAETRPDRSDKCIINYTCRLEDGEEEDFAEKAENYELGLGEGDVVQGLDVAIGLMNKNERCLLKIGSRLAFGERGLLPHIPGNATVMFDVELVDIQREHDVEKLSVQDRRQMGNKKRERGNWWYQRGENTLAIQCYRRALDFLDEVETENTEHQKPTSDSELQQLLEDRLKVLNNMASAQIKMELYDQALTSLQTVLRCQPDNVKALFRKAKIYSAKNDLPQSLKLLEKARALEPEDALIAKEIGTVTGLINKQKNSEKEYARRMFGGASPSASTSKTQVADKSKKASSNKIQILATLGATIIIGLAGMVAYRFKFT